MSSISQKIIKPKLGLLELAKQLGNVTQACKVMGYSRDTFYRYQELFENGGEEALQEISRKKPIEKNRVPDYIEDAVVSLAVENPALGQHRAANTLLQKGIIVSSSGVRSIWLRNGLETFKKRLKALEKKSAAEGILLTEEQLRCLEKAKLEKEAHGEIETEHPGYLGSQDTYFVGTMKGVGRIYQQTFIDTYSRVAFANLYTEKTAITAAHALNSDVLPWFQENDVPLLRVLTDRGTEYDQSRERQPVPSQNRITLSPGRMSMLATPSTNSAPFGSNVAVPTLMFLAITMKPAPSVAAAVAPRVIAVARLSRTF